MFKKLIFAALFLLPWLATGDEPGHSEFHLHWQDCAMQEAGATLRVSQGDEVTLHLHADTEVTLHLHGYDREIVVPAAGETKERFTAAIAGRFPVGIHAGCGDEGGRHRTAFYLEVLPR